MNDVGILRDLVVLVGVAIPVVALARGRGDSLAIVLEADREPTTTRALGGSAESGDKEHFRFR